MSPNVTANASRCKSAGCISIKDSNKKGKGDSILPTEAMFQSGINMWKYTLSENLTFQSKAWGFFLLLEVTLMSGLLGFLLYCFGVMFYPWLFQFCPMQTLELGNLYFGSLLVIPVSLTEIFNPCLLNSPWIRGRQYPKCMQLCHQ